MNLHEFEDETGRKKLSLVSDSLEMEVLLSTFKGMILIQQVKKYTVI
jgi:hypothetical protein